MPIRLPNKWKPRDYQMPSWAYLEKGGKRLVIPWHRRAGKDDIALHWAAVSAHTRSGNYWHLLPKANQARKALWDAVNPHTGKRRIDEAFPKELREVTRENDMLIRFKCGSTWQVVGSDNYDSLVGSPPVGVTLSEWALCDPKAWTYLQPILEENQGWAIFPYTVRGKNHGKALYDHALDTDGWHAELLSAETTGVFSKEQLENILREYKSLHGADEGEAVFRQEYLCDWGASLPGAYYGSILADLEAKKRITNVPYDTSQPVHTAWDLGIGDATAIWFIQAAGQEFHAIDYYETSGEGLQHYVKVLQSKGYVYGQHYAPHDIRARELGTGKSRLEVAKALGINFIVAPNLMVNEGIQAVRDILPRFWFDKEKTQHGYFCLHSYRKEWSDKRKEYMPHPLHDFSSHGADALRTFAVAYKPKSNRKLPKQDYKWVV